MYAADTIVNKNYEKSNDIIFTYDVPKPLFCKFVEECNMSIIKVAFGKHKCKKSYIYYNNHISRYRKLKILSNNPFVPILVYKEFIPPLFFQAALNYKLIFTNSYHIKNTFNYSNVVYENAQNFCFNYKNLKYDSTDLRNDIKHNHLHLNRLEYILDKLEY